MTSPQTPLRIIVADDQASVREGPVLLLGLLPDIEVVASADGIEATRQLTEHYPGVGSSCSPPIRTGCGPDRA